MIVFVCIQVYKCILLSLFAQLLFNNKIIEITSLPHALEAMQGTGNKVSTNSGLSPAIHHLPLLLLTNLTAVLWYPRCWNALCTAKFYTTSSQTSYCQTVNMVLDRGLPLKVS